MIKNQKQAAVVRKEIDDLIALIKEMDKLSATQKLDLKQQLQYNIWKGRIEDLLSEIKEYETLTSPDLRILEIDSERLEKAIVSFRIASGMTQSDLADRLEIQEQQIQRYEQNDYLTASFERVIQILKSLQVEVILRKEFEKQTKVIDINKFRLPQNYQHSITKTVNKVVERKQLVNW
jgi:DNA-binding XRE family transcriptional regulator